MVLEYERGAVAQGLCARSTRTSPRRRWSRCFAPLLDGLAVVHDAGYLHRDIKPDNIYVRDADGSLVLLDFGAARQTASETRRDRHRGHARLRPHRAVRGRRPPGPVDRHLRAGCHALLAGDAARSRCDAPARLDDPDPLPPAQSWRRDKLQRRVPRAPSTGRCKMHPSDRPQDVDAVPQGALRLARGRAGPAGGAAQGRRGGPRARGELDHGARSVRACCKARAWAAPGARSSARPRGRSR